MTAAVLIALLEAAGNIGVPVVMALIQGLNKETITDEDIQGLKIIKEPEEY